MKGERENVRPVREFGWCLESSSNCNTVLFSVSNEQETIGQTKQVRTKKVKTSSKSII